MGGKNKYLVFGIISISLLMLAVSLNKLYQRFVYISPPPCMHYVESSLHHEFIPDCRGKFTGRDSQEIEYSINHLGLREREFHQLLRKNSVAVLGDSHVEGWGLNFEETLSQQLEKWDGKKNYLNLGIRSSGPLMQSLIWQKQRQHIKAQEILWVLNENDFDDDRLSWALAQEDRTKLWRPAIVFSVEDFAGLKWQIPFFQYLPGQRKVWESMVKYPLYLRGLTKLREKIAEEKMAVCSPFENIKILYPQVKINFLLLSLGPYNHSSSATPLIERVLACLPSAKVLDLRKDLESRKDFYFTDDVHLNPIGTSWVARRWLDWNKEVSK